MHWITAFHTIFVIAWFAGLFYLPRLFVYHSQCQDEPASNTRFKVMEHKLYRYIMTPAGLLATAFGIILLNAHWQTYLSHDWMNVKLLCVLLLWGFQGYCGRIIRAFKHDKQLHTEKFYRWFNEIPTVLLIVIVVMVVVKPF